MVIKYKYLILACTFLFAKLCSRGHYVLTRKALANRRLFGGFYPMRVSIVGAASEIPFRLEDSTH